MTVTVSGLDRLLKPRTIAVFGGKEADRVIEQCDKLGFSGTIWPVHPTRKSMRGRPCLRSVDALPQAPDAAYVAVNREATIDIIEALFRRGAGGAVCYAAGFAEADQESQGAQHLQQRLVVAAGNMPIIGPNCYGFVNALERVALWPDQHGATDCQRGVAILTQSSNVAINLTMQRRGLPLAVAMTVGNQAQQGLSKIGMALLADERITALGLHIEGLDDVKQFEQLALEARRLQKPIVAIKVGRSEQAQAAALTHTASLAGSDVAHDALFRRLGIARVATLDSFLETLKLLHVGGPLSGGDLLSLSCSGGEASLMADAAHGHAVRYRPYSTGEAARVKAELGDLVTVANPLDYNTFIWGDWPAMIRMYARALEPDFDLALLVNDYPRGDRCDDADWQSALASFVAAVHQTGRRAANVASLAETMPESVAEHLIEQGIAPLCGLENAVIAAEAAAQIGRAWAAAPPEPLLRPETTKGAFQVLDEAQSKAALAGSGLICAKGEVFSTAEELDTALARLQWPLALKVLGIDHKSDQGAVVLNLHSSEDVHRALEGMRGLGERFLIEEMASAPLAELIVGITRDPVCGLTMTLGAGGVLTELLDDTASLLLPVQETEIRNALSQLKIGQLLDGYRRSDAADIDALVANIICIAKYAVSHADSLEELDVNPLFATQFGSIAVDALIVKRMTDD